MLAYLSADWMERAGKAIADDRALADAIADLDPGEGVTVVYVVRQVPEPIADDNGQVTYSIHLSSRYGAIFSSPAASTPTALEDTIILSLDYETAAAIHQGEMDPAVAMAMAKVQVRGAAGRLVALQGAFGCIPEALATLRGQTRY